MSKIDYKIKQVTRTKSPPRTYVKVRFYRGEVENFHDYLNDKTINRYVRKELLGEKEFKFYSVMSEKECLKKISKELKTLYKDRGEPVKEQLDV